MRATICALLVSLALGCVPPASEEEGLAVALELRPLEVERGWRLELWNGSDEHVELGCQDSICEVPTVRYEAQQADSTWVDRPSYTRFARELNLPVMVARRSSFVLGDGHYNLTDLDDAPGTYRAVVHTQNAGDVTLEYAVPGWSTETRRAALAIRARADAAGCWRLVQTCGGGLGEIGAALVGHLEPDALIDMHEGATGEAQPSIREAMLERGGFVVFLSELLSVGSMDTVREVATWLGSRADPIQEPLRAVATERLTEPLFGRGLVSAEDYELIHQLEGYWPDQTAARIVGRLEHGPEEGATLIALLDVLGSSWGDAFEGFGPRILAALPDRCEGATDERLVQSCEQVAIIYDPNSEFGFGGLSMRGTGCSGCGGSYHPPAACDAILREWNELETSAGELELVWLGTSI